MVSGRQKEPPHCGLLFIRQKTKKTLVGNQPGPLALTDLRDAKKETAVDPVSDGICRRTQNRHVRTPGQIIQISVSKCKILFPLQDMTADFGFCRPCRMPVSGKRRRREQNAAGTKPTNSRLDQFRRTVPAQDLPRRNTGVLFKRRAESTALLIRILCQQGDIFTKSPGDGFRHSQRIDIDRKVPLHFYAVVDFSSVKHMSFTLSDHVEALLR